MSDAPNIQKVASVSEGLTKTSSFNRHIRQLLSIREFGPFAVLVVQLAIFSIWAPAFYSDLNISNMLNFVPELGIIALGMTAPVDRRGIRSVRGFGIWLYPGVNVYACP